ncbi:helix-turn-helix domain-containing protein [Bradyrhizobium sp. AUGA SZCCT0283]|uniref:helix-turn-helix domain-containing protein n=1 Tax=Bradyrhizobium sp. AUGA SZCCT0283 TaxID=2807671 RepID=UPI001BAC212D|nr:helix-turn-helix domain-containing protein [Bradyrhizobium sp. AUGA SZCCT0283]MBR1273895.1 helix-turn-helix domain-containing protein [Bradyrhizobium sp. AUGA SZCCT0283]
MITSQDVSSVASPLPRGVRRALDAMHSNVGHNWRLTELAAIAGTSGRTLQRQFLAFVGRTPRAVLRDIGLECARRELLQGAPGVRIMDVALRCGFPHFGRFSIAYRRRYGETPSQTLKRQAVFTESLGAMPSHFLPSRDRPAVAFGPIEAAAENLEIAADIADDLITALTRAGISVATGSRSARYHLTGAIRATGIQAHLTIRLIDTESGGQLWAHRADGILRDDIATAEHLAARIAAALQPCLRLAEIDRALRKPATSLGAQDLALRAMPGVLSLDANGNARALEMLECAMDQDPNHPLATALAAWAHVQRVVYHFTHSPQEERARSLELAHRARALCGDATVLAILGNALSLLNEFDAADLVTRRALAIDGGSAWAWSRSGWIDVYKGDPQSAIERFKIALDLAPHDPLAFNSMVGIGCALFTAGQYAEGAHWQERALAEHPSASWVHRTLCPAYVLAGQGPLASRSLGALRQRYPDLTVSEVERGMPPLPPSQCDLVVGALQEAGLPA